MILDSVTRYILKTTLIIYFSLLYGVLAAFLTMKQDLQNNARGQKEKGLWHRLNSKKGTYSHDGIPRNVSLSFAQRAQSLSRVGRNSVDKFVYIS